MTCGRERRDVYYLTHGDIPRVVGMEIIPRQLSESAVGQKLRQHIACRRVKGSRVKIFHPIKETAGVANEGVEDLPTSVMPWTVIAHVDAADAQCRG